LLADTLNLPGASLADGVGDAVKVEPSQWFFGQNLNLIDRPVKMSPRRCGRQQHFFGCRHDLTTGFGRFGLGRVDQDCIHPNDFGLVQVLGAKVLSPEMADGLRAAVESVVKTVTALRAIPLANGDAPLLGVAPPTMGE
jgi:hypothetical protein